MKSFTVKTFQDSPTDYILLRNAELSDWQTLKAQCFSVDQRNNLVFNSGGKHAIDIVLLDILTNLGFVFAL